MVVRMNSLSQFPLYFVATTIIVPVANFITSMLRHRQDFSLKANSMENSYCNPHLLALPPSLQQNGCLANHQTSQHLALTLSTSRGGYIVDILLCLVIQPALKQTCSLFESAIEVGRFWTDKNIKGLTHTRSFSIYGHT